MGEGSIANDKLQMTSDKLQMTNDRVVDRKKVIVHRMKKLSCSASGGFILSKKIAELLRKKVISEGDQWDLCRNAF